MHVMGEMWGLVMKLTTKILDPRIVVCRLIGVIIAPIGSQNPSSKGHGILSNRMTCTLRFAFFELRDFFVSDGDGLTHEQIEVRAMACAFLDLQPDHRRTTTRVWCCCSSSTRCRPTSSFRSFISRRQVLLWWGALCPHVSRETSCTRPTIRESRPLHLRFVVSK